MIGQGVHGAIHHGFYAGIGSWWFTIGGVVVVGVIAAAVWFLSRAGTVSYESLLDRKRQELGLPPDGDQPPVT